MTYLYFGWVTMYPINKQINNTNFVICIYNGKAIGQKSIEEKMNLGVGLAINSFLMNLFHFH